MVLDFIMIFVFSVRFIVCDVIVGVVSFVV